MHNNQSFLTRLKKIEGQIKGIQKMIEEDRDCEDVLVQILAVQSGVKNIGANILKEHLNHCVKDGIESGEMETLERFTHLLNKFLS